MNNLNSVNLEAVAKFLRSQNVSIEDEVLVWKLLWAAIGTWLPRDLAAHRSVQLEVLFKTEGPRPHLGYLDLVLDDTLIADWKVFGGEPDDWKRRLKYGVQGAYYKEFAQHTWGGVVFRGINRKTLKCYEVRDQWDDAYFDDVVVAMETADSTHYWRRRTEGCWAFGRKCPYYAGCLGQVADPHPPEKDPETLIEHFSSHSIEEFLLCPQRYRRRRLVEIQGVPTGSQYDEEDSAESRIGTLFHLMIAIFYGTVFGLSSMPMRGAEKPLDLAQFRRINENS